jgi:HEAT repeat protein
LSRYSSHEHPRLRAQALHTLCQIEGPGGEELFLKGLNDPILEVRKRAVWCLGMIKSLRGIERVTDLLEQISKASPTQEDPLETQIYHALGISGNLRVRGKTNEEILLEVLDKRGMKQWWNPFQKNLLNESALGAICDALGKIGTAESLKRLTPLAKAHGVSWAPKAKEAAKRIEERTHPSKS